MNATQNVAYWDGRAVSAADVVTATCFDPVQRALELEMVERFFEQQQRGYRPLVLDIGCGAGWTESKIADRCSVIVGMDRSPEMIASARANFAHIKNAQFVDGSVLDMPAEWTGHFDLVLTQRCLINLSGWDEQKTALGEIARVLAPHGHYIMQEGSAQGRERLNNLRIGVGLEPLPPVQFNVNFDEGQLTAELAQHFDILSQSDFSLYDMISRVFQPMLNPHPTPHWEGNDAVLRLVRAGVDCSQPRGFGREFSWVLYKRP